MKCYFLILFIGFASCKTALLQSESKDKIIHFEVDKLGNIYTVNEKNIIKKINTKGQTFDFVDNRMGKISSIDVSNPLNILVYYQGQSLIRIIDNTMSEIKQVNLLFTTSFANISNVCWANDGNIWLYDLQFQKAFKINLTGKIISETNHFNDLGLNGFLPYKMIERNNLLCISDKNNRILLFDNFAQFQKQFVNQGIGFYFDGRSIYSFTKDNVKIQDILIPDLKEISLNPKRLSNFNRLIRENNAYYLVDDYEFEIIKDR
jgi:hypothetical protein